MANQRKNNNKMNMNMSRPSMLWLYGLIGAFIIGICENIIKGLDVILIKAGLSKQMLGLTTFSDAFTFALLIVILIVTIQSPAVKAYFAKRAAVKNAMMNAGREAQA